MDAILYAKKVLAPYKDKVIFVQSNFSKVKQILSSLEIDSLHGVLLDLGVSSFQLDTPTRGFSYNEKARLDMRMNQDQTFTAYEVVNTYTYEELVRIFKMYGEEKWSSRIANFIIENRKEKNIETTVELVEIIKNAIPASARRTGPHPATRVFQAIRIEVNKELEILEKAIMDFSDVLISGGRMCIISFHSLEDRIVKHTFRKLENPCDCPPRLPCVCGKKPMVKIVTKKPIIGNEEEIKNNPRARSAKLRVIEKL